MKQMIAIATAWLMLVTGAHAASFDCGKAGTPAEKMICGNAALSRQDDELEDAYWAALQTANDANALKREQRDWLRHRNRCSDIACLKAAYAARISVLQATASGPSLPAPRCAQCGAWNIYAAEVLGDSNGRRDVRVGTAEALVGEIMQVNAHTITIPHCGVYAYRLASSSTSAQNGTVSLNLVLKLSHQKNDDDAIPPYCASGNWTLRMKLDSSEFDTQAWGGTRVALESAAGKRLMLYAWNPQRQNISDHGSAGEGAYDVFTMARSKKALARAVAEFQKAHDRSRASAFNVERYAHKAMDYCDALYEADGLQNPAISNREIECATRILDAKTRAFAAKDCAAPPSASRNAAPCAAPGETIDSSVDYTE